LVIPFQTILDGGFRKAMPNAASWVERITKLPEAVKRIGHVKFAQKALKANTTTAPKEEKKQAPA
jgi:hypothetical protein